MSFDNIFFLIFINGNLLSYRINKIVTSNGRNLVTSKKPGTVLLMQNVDLGHTKVIQIR